jgi:hypothetical protein
MQKQALRWFAVSLAAAALMACGGGGSGQESPAPAAPAPTRAEGAYSGTLSGSVSKSFQLLMLENDEFWAIYGSSTAGQYAVAGFLQGQGASSNGSFSSSNVKDYGSRPPTSGTLSASYVVNTSVSGSVAAGTQTVSFTGVPIASSAFDYNSPANLSAVAGAWNLTGLDGSLVALSVTGSGAFVGSSAGCTFSGTFTPRPGGKNVFNVSLTFGAPPCALPNTTGNGIALSYLLTGSTTRQLIVAGVTADGSAGTALFGTR